MRWTYQPPTKPGWYWVRRREDIFNIEPTIAKVWKWSRRLRVDVPGVLFNVAINDTYEMEWAGPIPEPR